MKRHNYSPGGKRDLLRTYFDKVYNPVYDFIAARLASYQRLQSACVGKLDFYDGDKVLCAGVGTGNEVVQVLEIGKNVNVVGVDYSDTALRKAYRKALALGKEIEVLPMDVQSLEFRTGSFDEVLCLHVMDWVEDDGKATAEIIRVLKDGGQFVVTYPSDREGVGLGLNVLRDSILHNGDSGRLGMIYSILSSTLLGTIVYLPLLFRPKRKSYSRSQLETVFSRLTDGDFRIEEYPVYNDFIIYGRK